MPVICYNSIKNDSAQRLQKILETEALGEKMEIYKSFEGLCNRLCRINIGQNVAVILINDMTEFYQIFTIKKFLHDIRVILILPDRSAEVISAGHKLHPRFISYLDSDFNDVAVVLRRMIKLLHQGKFITENQSPELN
jgi:hypothetical protein